MAVSRIIILEKQSSGLLRTGSSGRMDGVFVLAFVVNAKLIKRQLRISIASCLFFHRIFLLLPLSRDGNCGRRRSPQIRNFSTWPFNNCFGSFVPRIHFLPSHPNLHSLRWLTLLVLSSKTLSWWFVGGFETNKFADIFVFARLLFAAVAVYIVSSSFHHIIMALYHAEPEWIAMNWQQMRYTSNWRCPASFSVCVLFISIKRAAWIPNASEPTCYRLVSPLRVHHIFIGNWVYRVAYAVENPISSPKYWRDFKCLQLERQWHYY